MFTLSNGDFQILNTGPTLEELRITGSAINTLNVAGNVIIDVNGILNLSNGNGISTLNIGGNITNDGGILLCSDFTSPYGNGIINLSGNLISNGSIIKVGRGTGNKLVMTGTTLPDNKFKLEELLVVCLLKLTMQRE
ncbi:MAG: hypothetical protein IPN55_13495 [Saprospiraceae bacterium]|nr:hypothetical protein [Candidatus Brachybacter algidus]